MLTIRSHVLVEVVAPLALLVGGGCFLPGLPASLTEIPAELRVVIDDPNGFAPAPDDPLADVAPGTPIDNLSELTGCWGSAEPAEYSLGGGPLIVCEVYQFDADAQTANRWVFTPGVLFLPPIIAIDEGSFSVLDGGRIQIRVERFTVVGMRSGAGQVFTDLPEDIALLEKLVTLDGDQLLIAVPDRIDPATGEPIGRIFTRFGCPE